MTTNESTPEIAAHKLPDVDADASTNMEECPSTLTDHENEPVGEEEETKAQMKDRIQSTSFSELGVRRVYITSRLEEITIEGKLNTLKHEEEERENDLLKTVTEKDSNNNDCVKHQIKVSPPSTIMIPKKPKEDTHWDFVLKELMWLSTDFQSERKRQMAHGKKLSAAVRQFFKTQETRRQRKQAEEELRQRRMAARLAKDVKKHFWNKIERVIGYKQKLTCDQEKQQAMDRHLMSLIQKTEEYGKKHHSQTNLGEETSSTGDDSSVDQCGTKSKQKRQSKEQSVMEIEEALQRSSASNKNSRLSRKLHTDYRNVKVSKADALQGLYGEAATQESEADDEEFQYEGEVEDDLTTFVEAERLIKKSDLDHELEQLRIEGDMDVEELRALYHMDTTESEQPLETPTDHAERENIASLESSTTRPSSSATSGKRQAYSGSDADDDADISDVEDYDIAAHPNDSEDSSGEYHLVGDEEQDDETTLIAEELMGRDMSYEDEIALLEQENNMSIDQLRERYLGMKNGSSHHHQMLAAMQEELSDQQSQDESVSTTSSQATPTVRVGRPSRRTARAFNLSLMGLNPTASLEAEPLTQDALSGSEGEFVANDSEVDDETTLIEEEKHGRQMTYEEEIKILERENAMSVEELRAFYANPPSESNHDSNGSESQEVSRGGDSLEKKPHNEKETSVSSSQSLSSSPSESSEREIPTRRRKREAPKDTNEQAKKIKPPSSNKEVDEALERLREKDRLARETNVSRPFILAPWVKLRAYQQIGLNWLVSIQTRRLNGILADEMGLGKTLQTISMLAYLAAYKGIWGPHLIIVPTSCMVNWETEIKRFCPAFKVLCYYGSAKRRKELRQGWTRTNWHHIVITSYQLAVQDSFAFKRKRWYYLILDEAHNIKNFQSQRWQTLISFNTQRRLLLTGTPLQNNLMELWSLLHFLMPHVFSSRKEFSYWFSNPMNNIIEGNTSRNDELIGRLHGIIRPFVLRRLKKEVEKQMPGKFEHIVKTQLSRRQMFLYEEFMSRSSTRKAMKKGGNFMGMMNVLMQLRKVCNHPDLFEPRSIVTPFFCEPIDLCVPGCVIDALYPRSGLDQVSANFIHPLWSVGCDLPTFENSIEHDDVISSQLQNLNVPITKFSSFFLENSVREPKPDPQKHSPGLLRLLTSMWDDATKEAIETGKRIFETNNSRCIQESHCYNIRKIKATEFMGGLIFGHREDSPSFIAETPAALLAMRRSQQQRADDMEDLVRNFVFCVPNAAGRKVSIRSSQINTVYTRNEPHLMRAFSRPLANYFRVFQEANSRLSSFFPEKKLVQFDAGKLCTLAELLRERKKGGHRVLIFTQMSKMLDILEAFLNLNGHTYLRLDGGTGVDARQRLMDRFNNDVRVFCFILSTRSGGLGINLTGADTVIFYDTDWNPAMDAQAQDRAHRIGQTRDVHIFRLITEQTIEENILLKAKQKKQLDFLVMEEGKFTGQSAKPTSQSIRVESPSKVSHVFTKGGLRDILGLAAIQSIEDDSESEAESDALVESDSHASNVEDVMAAFEDEADVAAMQGAKKEANDELQEFDETIQYDKEVSGNEGRDSQDEDASQTDGEAAKSATIKRKTSSGKGSVDDEASVPDDSTVEASDTEADEKEFEAWQDQVGVDISTLEESLKPTERYALNFKEEIDPYYSSHFLTEMQGMQENEAGEDRVDLDVIEEMKAEEEQRAIEQGELLATQPQLASLLRQRHLYIREKSRLHSEKKRRKLLGKNWSLRHDAIHNFPFWYNEDTGEATWDKPQIILELEAEDLARKEGWNLFPVKPLLNIMDFLVPYPDRTHCGKVCRQWRWAAGDFSFVKHVWPVEMGALSMNKSRLEKNHYVCIEDALLDSLPGDTIELGDGHYWVNSPGLVVNYPIRFLGDEKDPSHVVIELSGSIRWKGRGGWIEGVTVRRSKVQGADFDMFCLEESGHFDMAHCVFDNARTPHNTLRLSTVGGKSSWLDITITGATENYSGLVLEGKSTLSLEKSKIEDNDGYGVLIKDRSVLELKESKLRRNGKSSLQILGGTLHYASKGNISDDASTLAIPCFQTLDDTSISAFVSEDEKVSKPDEKTRTSVDNKVYSAEVEMILPSSVLSNQEFETTKCAQQIITSSVPDIEQLDKKMIMKVQDSSVHNHSDAKSVAKGIKRKASRKNISKTAKKGTTSKKKGKKVEQPESSRFSTEKKDSDIEPTELKIKEPDPAATLPMAHSDTTLAKEICLLATVDKVANLTTAAAKEASNESEATLLDGGIPESSSPNSEAVSYTGRVRRKTKRNTKYDGFICEP